VAARVSPQRARELTPALLAAGVEILIVQGTIIFAEHVSDGEPLNLKDFIAEAGRPGRRRRGGGTTAPRCT
jgi:IMP dehydrogenase